jgi:hypothetical protein
LRGTARFVFFHILDGSLEKVCTFLKLVFTGKTLQPNLIKQSSLLGPFVGFEENKVLLIQQVPFSQHFIFFITYDWAQ